MIYSIISFRIPLTTFISLSLTAFSFGQQYEFILYEKNPCNGQSTESFTYNLEKDGIEYTVFNAEGKIKLPKKGGYLLKPVDHPYIPITIDSLKNSYEIEISRIQEFIVTHDDHGYIFMDCSKPLNGEILTYYQDNQVRFFGTFKNGYAIGFLTELHVDGTLKRIRLFDENGFLIKKVFDSTQSDVSKK